MNDRYEEGTRTEKSKPPHSKPKATCKNKNTFDLWYDGKNCQLKKPEANRLQKQQTLSSFPKPTATNEAEISKLKEVTN